MAEHIDYVELRAGDMQASKAFYAAAFGWRFTDYGPEYAAFEGAGLDGGLDATTPTADRPPLVILKSDDLEDTLGRVEGAGGVVTVPIFAFPRVRRCPF